jgi:23S rRNA pseudouridine2605 synthase
VAAERLQKIIAAAGIASRRKAEELIAQGRVTLNGQVITEPGTKADLQRDHVKVDGKLLRGLERHVYLLVNKPKGYVATVSDPEGRPTVMDLVKHVGERIYPVGRLDYGSEGLLLMTNDGELANFLTRAASHVPKTYLVKIAGRATEEEIDKLRHGIRIGSKPGARGIRPVRTAPAEVRMVRETDNPWYEVTLIEGKNRQIRRMFEEIGRHVEKIKRVRYGPLQLDVEPGEFRELTAQEVTTLRKAKPARSALAPDRSAANQAARFLGKAATKSAERRRFRPRIEERTTANGANQQFDSSRRREPRQEQEPASRHEAGKHSRRGERESRGFEQRNERSQSRGQRSGENRQYDGMRSEFRQERGLENRAKGQDGPRREQRGDRSKKAFGPRSRSSRGFDGSGKAPQFRGSRPRH